MYNLTSYDTGFSSLSSISCMANPTAAVFIVGTHVKQEIIKMVKDLIDNPPKQTVEKMLKISKEKGLYSKEYNPPQFGRKKTLTFTSNGLKKPNKKDGLMSLTKS